MIDKVDIIYQQDGDKKTTKQALLRAKKQWVREQVVESEQGRNTKVAHFPESLCLELTPHCILSCGHCATHGTPEAHRHHNELPEIPQKNLDYLAEEVFPSLTSVSAIGRGEPLCLSQTIWNSFIDHLRANHVLLSIVTNGVLVKRRITPEIIPLIDTLTISIDGLTQDTFGSNRSKVKISKIVDGIAYFDKLRRDAALPRRPKLCLSWTMKKNNIHELPEFLEAAKDFEPDILFTRHLMIFHEHDRDQSLLSHPEESNPHLEKAYKRLKELGIRYECPPIAEQQLEQAGSIEARTDDTGHVDVRPLQDKGEDYDILGPVSTDPCMFVYRTANIHSDGRIYACPRPNSPLVGKLGDSDFPKIWYGDEYSRLRKSLNTDNEIFECRYCWYRESRYYPQRFQLDTDRKQSYSILKPVKYLRRSWDFAGN